MKKLFALSLSAVMIFALAACSSEPESTGNDANGPDSFQVQENQEFVLTRGVYNEDRTVYTNKSTGISFTLPEDWYAYTDDEVAEQLMPSVTGGELAAWGEEEMRREVVIPDTIIVDPNVGNNMILQYENLAAENATFITDEDYRQVLKGQLDKLEYDYEYTDQEDITLCGRTFHVVGATVTANGVQASQYMAFSRVDDYMICLVFSSFDGMDFDMLATNFN